MKTKLFRSLETLITILALFRLSPNAVAQVGLPVYQVLQSGASANQASTLASSFGISPESLSLSNGEVFYFEGTNFMAIPTAPVTDAVTISNLLAGTKNDFPQFPVRFEQIDFTALGRLLVLSSNTAMNSISSAFDKANLIPQFGVPVIGHAVLTAYFSNSANVVISNSQFLDTQIKYAFTDSSEHPLIGPGAQVQVAFGTNGRPTRFLYAARRLTQGRTVAIITPNTASNRVAGLFPGLNAQITPQLAYYCPPLSLGTVSNIIPWYACIGTGTVTNPATGKVSTLNLLPQLIPATDDPAFVPSADLSASVLGGTQVVANVKASGGMAPYSYMWSGSSPTISSNTGAQIAYIPTVRVQPPVVGIARQSPQAVTISWVDPSTAFVLESTPGIQPTAWGAVTNPVQTISGVRSVTVSPNASRASFFRLRYSGKTVSETVMVTVTDANGVQVQASQILQVQPAIQAAVRAQSKHSPKIVGTVDWGTESPFDPGLGNNDRNSWTTGMSLFGGGGVQRFLWTGGLSWRWDFIEEPTGIDNSEVDNADITLYIGHGNPTVITFTATDPLYFNQATHSWGDLDQEWMCFLSCDVLEFNDPNGNVWQRWGPNFDGLHILTGFSSLAYAGTGFPGGFALNMLGIPFPFFPPPMSIVNAWFNAAHAHGTGTPAAMGPIGPGGVWDFGDFYWGKGSVGPTIRASQIRGWWYLN